MLRGNDEGIFPQLFRNPLMWVGFALPFAIQVLDGLNHYFFFVPEVRLVFDPLMLFRDSVRLHIFVNFAIIGVAYFLNLNVAFSVWFFPLVEPLPDRGFQRRRLSDQRAQRGADGVLRWPCRTRGWERCWCWWRRSCGRRGATCAKCSARRSGAGYRPTTATRFSRIGRPCGCGIACAAYFFGWLLLSGVPVVAAVVFSAERLPFSWPLRESSPKAAWALPLRPCCRSPLRSYLGHGRHRLEGAGVRLA